VSSDPPIEQLGQTHQRSADDHARRVGGGSVQGLRHLFVAIAELRGQGRLAAEQVERPQQIERRSAACAAALGTPRR
jgi:hypothetical protein